MAVDSQRLDLLETEADIRRLVARYAIAYDARDLATLEQLYTPEVRAGAMEALRAKLPPGRTFHLMADPVLTMAGPDAARGVVLGRVECEQGAEWIVAGVRLDDRYVRVGDAWHLADRVATTLYAADVLARP